MTAQELYEKAISEPIYSTHIRVQLTKHLHLAPMYPLGEKAYYEKAMYDILQDLSINHFYTTWVNNGYKNIFEGDVAKNVFAWVDDFIKNNSEEESENPKVVAKLRKIDENFYRKQFSEFSSSSTIYYWLQKRLNLLTDAYSNYFASRKALNEYEKVENQLVEKGYYDYQKGWLNNVVTLQALIKKLYEHHYFSKIYTGKTSNPYKGLYPFIESHFHINVGQNFERSRVLKVETLYYIKDIYIKPL